MFNLSGISSRLAITLSNCGATAKGMLWAYDFNLAFDERFERRRFFESPVFGGMLKQWPAGFRERRSKGKEPDLPPPTVKRFAGFKAFSKAVRGPAC